MPSFDLFTHFQSDLLLQKSWYVNGKHYGQTCEDWLTKQDEGTSTWLGGGREDELITGGRGGETVESRKLEGRKSFFR